MYSTVLWEDPCMSRPPQSKPVLFKGQLSDLCRKSKRASEMPVSRLHPSILKRMHGEPFQLQLSEL